MDNLSQDELDALIDEAAEAEDEPQGELPVPGHGAGADESALQQSSERLIHSYDFNQPFSLSRGFERTLRNICESFSKVSSLSFTNLFRSNSTFSFTVLKLVSFGEAMAPVDNPACIGVATLAPLKGIMLVTLDAGIMFSMFTKLLGGPVEESGQVRDFTEIEMGMARKIVLRILENLTGASERVLTLEPDLGQMENNPSYVNAFGEGETVVTLEFSLALDEVTGTLRFVIPLAAFEPVLEVFDPREGIEIRSEADKRRDRQRIKSTLQEANAALSARFAPRPMSMGELLKLREGDVIPLGHATNQPLTVEVEGRPMFEGFAGRISHNRAIRILHRRKVR